MAKIERLNNYIDLSFLHGIVEKSYGAYNYDQAFELEVGFAYSLQLMHLEKEMYQQRFAEFDRLLKTQ